MYTRLTPCPKSNDFLDNTTMAQTSGYDYDIFISYAHDDNTKLSGNNGWVTQFHELLYNWLKKLRGKKKLKIWFDENNLGGNTYFDDAIKKGVEKSALFFVIHSQNYHHSTYCNQEFDWFIQYNQRFRNGIKVGDNSRLFNIQIQNIHYDQWPEKFSGTSGFVLHDSCSDGPGIPTSPSHNGQLFDRQMRKVVDAAGEVLDAISLQASIYNNHISPEDQIIPKVFIANVPDSLKAFRNQLVSEIGDKAEVLDQLPPPFEMVKHQEALGKLLNQASLSIHLLDQFSGTEIIGALDGKTFPRVQAETALQGAQRSLVWIPDTLVDSNIEETEQASWLNKLEIDDGRSRCFSFVRSSRQTFVGQVNQLIDEITEKSISDTPLSRLLIDTHYKDQRHAYRLADILADRGIDVDFNKESVNPIKSLENFENIVREVEHLIIMFGRVSPKWVSGRIRTAARTVVNEQDDVETKLENISVFMLPSCPGKKTIIKVPKVFKLNYLDNSNNDQIEKSVVEALLNAKGVG